MTAQLKQRIVGIIVLLFLALIILPWIFGKNQPAVFESKADPNKKEAINETPHKVNNALQETSTPIPSNLETTPINDDTTLDEPTETKEVKAPPRPKIKPGPITPKVVINDDKDHTLKPATEELEPAKISSIQNHMMHTNASDDEDDVDASEQLPPIPKKKGNAKTAELSKVDLAKVKTGSKPAKVIAAKDKSDKNWAVQLGSFSDSNNATKLVKELKDKGYPAYTKLSKKANGDEVTRVFVGPKQREEAQNIVGKIDKLFKVHGVVVKAQ